MVLTAEHKRTAAEFSTAVTELASKMLDWDVPGLRELPFLPCYAVGSKWLRFLALTRPPQGGAAILDAAVVCVSPMFDVSEPAHVHRRRLRRAHHAAHADRVQAAGRPLAVRAPRPRCCASSRACVAL